MAMVPKKLIAKITHTRVIAQSIGQMSSAYSWVWVRPNGSVSAAETMMSCQPQKWRRDSVSFHIRVLSRRCIE